MKTASLLSAALLAVLILPVTADGAERFVRFGGGYGWFSMSDFNAGIEQSNEILRNSYRRDLEAQYPDWEQSGIENEVDAAARGNTLDELTGGASFFFTFGQEFGKNLSLGLEIERIVGANQIIHNPEVLSSYEAPATFYKLVAEFRTSKEKSLTFGFGGAVGWAQADGYLKMPIREPRTNMQEAYLSGNGLLVEGTVTPYYRLSEGTDLFLNVGYRLAQLSESDQTWFTESDGGTEPGSVIPIDTSIPLRLDYSGLFLRLGLRVDWPW
jgi:hypothetical protein